MDLVNFVQCGRVIGGLLLVALISGCMEEDRLPVAMKTGSATTQPANQKSETTPAATSVKLDFTKPVYTSNYAIICRQGLLIDAAMDHRAGHGMDDVYEMFTSISGRSEKVKALGCEEWRSGIRVNARPMESFGGTFISVSLSSDSDWMYFTMSAELTNDSYMAATQKPENMILDGPKTQPISVADSVDIGRYVLSGTIQDGSGVAPGLNAVVGPGNTYPGLLVDRPLDFTRITKGMNLGNWPALQRGYLENIQLVMTSEKIALYKKYLGKHVAGDCNIDFAGRYFTPVFCGVNSIVEMPVRRSHLMP